MFNLRKVIFVFCVHWRLGTGLPLNLEERIITEQQLMLEDIFVPLSHEILFQCLFYPVKKIDLF